MSINALLNHMRAQAQLVQGTRAGTRFGLVSSYDPDNYCVKVRLQPDDVETGWLPLAAAWVGNGWGLFTPPAVDDMVEVDFQEGQIDAGFVRSRLFSDSDRPLAVPAGECWLVHGGGAFIKLLNSGVLELNSAEAVKVRAPAVSVCEDEAKLQKLLTATFKDLFDSHTHMLDVPQGLTLAPLPLAVPLPKPLLTSVLEAE